MLDEVRAHSEDVAPMLKPGAALRAAMGLTGVLAGYLALWPVPIEPVAWTPPPDAGYVGPFARNERLSSIELLSVAPGSGPEDVAIDAEGRLYVATAEGHILKLRAEGTHPEVFADTGGRPLGIDFDAAGRLIVADAYRGLLAVSPDGKVTVLATECDGVAIRFADDVDVAADGRIYFSDATTRFGARESGGTHAASLLDLMEHGRTGRLLVHDPRTGATSTVATGFAFANGVAVSPDQRFVLLNETGEYRVWRVFIAGERMGQKEVFLENLPGFPDNVSTGLDGRFWIALVSPRSPPLDSLGPSPLLRKVVQRLPAFMRPRETHYGHVFAVDAAGKVVADLQDPGARQPVNTSVIETTTHLYVGSLVAGTLGRLPREAAKL